MSSNVGIFSRERAFSATTEVRDGSLFCTLHSLRGRSRSGAAFSVEPSSPLSVSAPLQQFGDASAVEVFVSGPLPWQEFRPDATGYREPQLNVLGVEDPQRAALLTAGLVVGAARRAGSQWSAASPFLPWVAAISGDAHVWSVARDAIEVLSRLQQSCSDAAPVDRGAERKPIRVDFSGRGLGRAADPAKKPAQEPFVRWPRMLAALLHQAVQRMSDPDLAVREFVHQLEAISGACRIAVGDLPGQRSFDLDREGHLSYVLPQAVASVRGAAKRVERDLALISG